MTRLFDSRKANSLIFHELEPYEFTLFNLSHVGCNYIILEYLSPNRGG